MNTHIDHLFSEQPSGPSRADVPGLSSITTIQVLRITPDEVAEGALVRYLLVAVYGSNLVQGVDLWRKTSVYTEDLPVYQSSNCHQVEHLATQQVLNPLLISQTTTQIRKKTISGPQISPINV